ncbi:MAG TPA: outer membrane lipoprotein chaperone LolA [Marinagarivorans sp.]
MLTLLKKTSLAAIALGVIAPFSGHAANATNADVTKAETSAQQAVAPLARDSGNTADKAASKAREQLVKRLSALKTLKGQFIQTLSGKDGKQLQETQGDFTFKHPGFYHWQSDDPYPQTVVGNGETVWIYDPDLEQVTIAKQATMPYNPANLLSGGFNDLAARYAIAQSVNGDSEQFVLTPLERASAPFVELGIHFSAGVLQEAILLDRLGQTTRISFSKTNSQVKVDDSFFDFDIPAGTDILMND